MAIGQAGIRHLSVFKESFQNFVVQRPGTPTLKLRWPMGGADELNAVY